MEAIMACEETHRRRVCVCMYVGFIHKCCPVWGGVVCLPRVPALALLRRVFPPIVIIMVAVSLVRVRKRARVTTSIVALIHTHTKVL